MKINLKTNADSNRCRFTRFSWLGLEAAGNAPFGSGHQKSGKVSTDGSAHL
jgi:hypothetical protein